MFSFLRRHTRMISYTLLFSLWCELSGNVAWALTSGPSQPEMQQFAPAGMDNMVDPFTGDFSYNIPLMDVGGYPINLNYASGITPDAEASWVGLGWNLNVGAITRNMRGLPDDFAGDEVVKDLNIRPNQTYGISGSYTPEIYGFKFGNSTFNIGFSANLFYNNYNGFGMSLGVSPSISAGLGNNDDFTGNMGLGLSLGSESGLEVTPKLGIKSKQSAENSERTLSAGLSFPFSTREGLKGMTLNGGYSRQEGENVKVNGKDRYNSNESGFSTGAFQGFATPTYVPSFDNDMYNINASLNVSFGITNPGTENPVVGLGGYYSGQFLKDTRKASPAYGYMYSGMSSSESKLLDFNREKDGGYTKFTTNLALANMTYDVFQVSGQGVSGAYRLYRGDVGTLHDPAVRNQGYSPSLGIDIGVGSPPSAKVGADVQFNYSQQISCKWPSERSAIRGFQNESSSSLNNAATEITYFKRMGELSPESDLAFQNNVQQSRGTVRHELSSSYSFLGDGQPNGRYSVISKNESTGADVRTTPAIPSVNKRQSERRIRSTAFTALTAKEAAKSAVLPIETYERNNFNWYQRNDLNRSVTASNAARGYKRTPIDRQTGGKRAHHISEARVTDESGTRYIYGIPAYNNLQEEVTFAVEGGTGNTSTGLVSYSPGSDDSKDNDHGLDHYYNKVSTPAYAHSYLLTCILSSDYVDRDNIPGPSDGDLGTYTKFNYTRVIERFKWRTPFSAGSPQASYSEGMYGSDDDDKGNYVYGEKEVWYLHSIETRTHVAEFYLKDRLDARGVAGREGGLGNEKQQCLDKIVLYSKPDKWNSSAEAIKVVYFEYDYSLCPGTPNSETYTDPVTSEVINPDQGKLTLKKLWFTYGKSKKGVLNPYVFEYAQDINGDYSEALNPSYSFKNYDRWGNYKQDNLGGRSNAEFPYAVQDKELADQYAAVYALSSIRTPTAGTLRILYESDDYAYVQNKRAMRMFGIVGAEGGDGTEFYTGTNPNQKDGLIIDLDEGFKPLTEGTKDEEFRRKYLSGIDLMYYKVLLRTLTDGNRYDYVPGYAEIDIANSHLTGAADGEGYYKQAIIKLKSVNAQNGKAGGTTTTNPIVRNGWMFARLNLSREMMGSANASDSGLEQVLRSILSMAQSLVRLATGFTGQMILQKNSSKFNPSKSFVRLNEPDKVKLGGGHRVKALVMADNWGLMNSSRETSESLPAKQTAYYGQFYDYTYDENGVQISSGVAAYEPIMGNEENPFRRPVFVREKVPLAPAKEYFLEEPFGESFFPAATVGYRKVTVTPVKIVGELNDETDFTGNGTGRVEHEFYTAYDFPTITRRTEIQAYRHKPNILFKFMKFDCRDLVTCSQGYYVELNDMHGKQKAQRVYPETSSESPLTFALLSKVKPISEVEYRYKTNSDGTLNNRVTYVDNQLNVLPASSSSTGDMGVDIDMVQDERYSESTTLGGGVQLNLKYIQAAIIPIFVPTGFPDLNSEQTRFRSLVTTKVVNRYGILESTTAKDNGASITTTNLAWDKETGKVLLTEVQNEFHQPIYSFSYPAYWAYERMDRAATNEGLTFTPSGFAALKNSALRDGDELYLESTSDDPVFYVVDQAILDKSGVPVTGYSKGKVIRSGSRNMPMQPIGSITTLKNPIRVGSSQLVFEEVLNAGATEFSEGWKRFCNCAGYESDPARSTNPYVLGTKGNLRAKRSLTYLTERTQSQLNNELSIRKDGYFKDFSLYWLYSDGVLVPPADIEQTKWQYVTEITKYNPVGMEIENVDALNRYSMAQFGYSRNLPVATSNNSRYRESGYDGFEDYQFGDCEDDHFSWRTFGGSVTSNEAHTGKKSIAVDPEQNLKIRKVINPCGNSNP